MQVKKRSTIYLAGMALGFAALLASLSSAAFAQNPVPFVNQPLVPDGIAPIGQAFTLTVNGTGFVAGAVVNWNGHSRTTTFVSSSKLTAAIPASDITKAGSARVTVLNPGPGGGLSNVSTFEIAGKRTSLAFTQSANYGTGSHTTNVVTGDFNGDGYLDLAAVDNTGQLGGGGLTVLLGFGAGIFYPQPTLPIVDAYALATGDFNKDGKLDVAVGSWVGTAPAVTVLLGNGDGTFQLGQTFTLAARAVAVGDLNGDGNLDLVVGGNAVTVFLGQGDGTFTELAQYQGNEAWSLALGDFNHDSHLDCAYVGGGNTVIVQLGNGNGTFRAPVAYATGSGSVAVIAADFSRDGKLDLAVANQLGGTASILLGRADGTFASPSSFPAGLMPNALAVGDFNSDGNLDLAVGNIGTGKTTVSILSGNGDGTLGAAQNFATTFAPNGIAAADINADGKLDVVFAGLHSVSTMVQTKPKL